MQGRSDDQDCRSCGAGGGTVDATGDDGNGGEGDSAGDGEGDSTGDGDGVGSYDQGLSFCLGHSDPETPSCSAVTFQPDASFSVIVDFGCRRCVEDVQVDCSATLEGDVVTIETFVSASREDSNCAGGGDGDGFT